MSCQDVAFQRGRCRIEVEPDTEGPAGLRFKATMYALDETGEVEARPITFPDGARAMFVAESEPLAYSAALTWLERHFGGFTEKVLGCDDRAPEVPVGNPVRVPTSS